MLLLLLLLLLLLSLVLVCHCNNSCFCIFIIFYIGKDNLGKGKNALDRALKAEGEKRTIYQKQRQEHEERLQGIVLAREKLEEERRLEQRRQQEKAQAKAQELVQLQATWKPVTASSSAGVSQRGAGGKGGAKRRALLDSGGMDTQDGEEEEEVSDVDFGSSDESEPENKMETSSGGDVEVNKADQGAVVGEGDKATVAAEGGARPLNRLKRALTAEDTTSANAAREDADDDDDDDELVFDSVPRSTQLDNQLPPVDSAPSNPEAAGAVNRPMKQRRIIDDDDDDEN